MNESTGILVPTILPGMPTETLCIEFYHFHWTLECSRGITTQRDCVVMPVFDPETSGESPGVLKHSCYYKTYRLRLTPGVPNPRDNRDLSRFHAVSERSNEVVMV